MSSARPNDNREEIHRAARAEAGRFDATMRAAADFAKAHEDRWRRTEAAIKEKIASFNLDLRAFDHLAPVRIPDLKPAVARFEAWEAPLKAAADASMERMRQIAEAARPAIEKLSIPAMPAHTFDFPSCSGPGPATVDVINLPSVLEEIRDLLKSDRDRRRAESPADADPGEALPVRWGGPWIPHSAAARILGYTSAQSRGIASGDTLRKAIKAAPEGDPLALLRDRTQRCAKSPSGRLRRDAVVYVAGLRDSPLNEAVGTRTMPERGKTRSERARNAE